MNQTQQAELRAGVGCRDITPGEGVQLGGGVGEYRPGKMVGDPLYARALIMETDGRRLCFVALDLVLVTKRYCDLIRQSAGSFGLPEEAVMVHAIQTHSAPGLGRYMMDDDFPGILPEHEWICGNDDTYSMFVVEQAIESIKEAYDNLAPVRLGIGSGIEGRFAFNRRAVNREGTISMPWKGWEGGPLGPTWIRYIEGPTDPELGVMCLLSADSLKPMCILANYTCHPVHVYPKPIISADWPGAVCRSLQDDYGVECMPMVLNGACGNINPWPPFDPDYVEDHNRMGRGLADMAGKVIEEMNFSNSARLDYRTVHLKIPFRQIDEGELDSVRKVLAEHPEPVWLNEERTSVDQDWLRATSLYSVYLQQQREKEFDYEIQIFRIGDAVFVGLPGEPFVECGLKIKLASPTYPTYIVHLINQYVGYIPTGDSISRGGHEASVRYWSKLAPQAMDSIVACVEDTLANMFRAG